MTLKRFEILLPLNYNDGRPIERAKFRLTHSEIVGKFGATTVDSVQAMGSWVHRGVLYRDRLIRVRIEASNPEEAAAFFRSYKEVLKKRFHQIDIWITAYEVEMI